MPRLSYQAGHFQRKDRKMNRISFNLWKDGKRKCLTLSYDDGRFQDRRLVEIFNRYKVKGTFHLNSGRMINDSFVSLDEVSSLYNGHEVSCHMRNHPFSTDLPSCSLIKEIEEDRRCLEEKCGYIVRGMSYPYGNYDARAINCFRHAGMEYSRTVASTQKFSIPEDFMKWHPTCQHNMDLLSKTEAFLKPQIRYYRPELFYVWGHSYEFDNDNNWELIEEFCKRVSGNDDVWYATNIEIVDYVNATRALRFSEAMDMVYNPTATTVWMSVNSEKVEVPAGVTVRI